MTIESIREPVCPIPDRLAILDTLSLQLGSHRSFDVGHCVNEVAAWLVGEDHTDAPSCVCPSIRAVTMRANDRILDDARRTRMLLPLVPVMVGTRGGEELHKRRMWLAVDWSVRVASPRVLRASGAEDSAARLEACAPIVDRATAHVAYGVARAERGEQRARREKAFERIYAAVAVAVAVAADAAAAVAVAVAADADAAAAMAADSAMAVAVAADANSTGYVAMRLDAAKKARLAGGGWTARYHAALEIAEEYWAKNTRLRPALLVARDENDAGFVDLVNRMAALVEEA